ncbi:MAG TPA: YdeI/OmpD-associated family protein [Jiangellales bacterium]|nr:YdeI/OmpD-associated family protein [Jiangellales bacterium]
MGTYEDGEQVHPADRAEWRAWLAEHHGRGQGVWMVSWRKASGHTPLTYDEAVEEALCFGWVDSRPRKLDDHRTMLWFSPRKPGSGWSRPNKQRVARMESAGLMAEAGRRAVEVAQADGSWTALDEVEALTVPDDLAEALEARPPAAEEWEAFPRSVKRGVLEWISTAKRHETRAKRVEETARLAQVGERANQWRPRSVRTEPD